MVGSSSNEPILSFVPFVTLSLMFGVVGFLLAREKGRNVPLWTIRSRTASLGPIHHTARAYARALSEARLVSLRAPPGAG